MGIDTDVLSAGKVIAGVFAKNVNNVQKATTGAAVMNNGINYFAYTALAAGSTVTGPSAPISGQEITLKNESAGAFAITFAPASGTIDGSATLAVTAAAAWAAGKVRFDGANWFTTT
jgi:hypothetical protein